VVDYGVVRRASPYFLPVVIITPGTIITAVRKWGVACQTTYGEVARLVSVERCSGSNVALCVYNAGILNTT